MGRPRPRRVPGVRDAVAARLRQPGLEGRRRRGAPSRRQPGAAADRPRRAAGLRLRRQAPDGGPVRPRRPRARRQAAASPGGATCSTGSTSGSGGTPRTPTTWGSTASKRPIESVASNPGHLLAVGDRARRPRGAHGAAPACRRPVVRLGDPDAVRGPRRVQPVLVPHGVGLAARQRDHRRRAAALRVRRRGRAGREGHVRRRRAPVAPTGCPSCSPGCRATRRRSRSSTSGPTSRRPGPRRRSCAWSPSCAGSTPAAIRRGAGSTSTRPCRTGCRRSRCATCGPGRGPCRWPSTTATIRVLDNSTGIRGRARRAAARRRPVRPVPELNGPGA